jgi:vacuolar-type H+-ATPase subunit I/STV1
MSLNRKFIASQATETGIEDAGVTAIMNAHNSVVQTLKDDLEKEKAETAKVQAELAAAKNPNDEEIQKLKSELEAAKSLLESEKTAHAATKESLEKALSDEKTAHIATKTEHQTEKSNASMDKAVGAALEAAGMSKGLIPYFIKAGYDRTQLTQDADGNFSGIDKFVESVKANPEHSGGFGAIVTVGADVGTPPPQGSYAKNPWLKESRDLAEQTRIYRENREVAISMAKAAGITLE